MTYLDYEEVIKLLEFRLHQLEEDIRYIKTQQKHLINEKL